MRNSIRIIFCLLSLLAAGNINAQEKKDIDDSGLLLKQNLKKHISFLSDDALEGRATGTKGEQMAYKYIINEFEQIGLQNLNGETDFISEFDFYNGMLVGPETMLKINNINYGLHEDFFPVAQSASGNFTGKIVNVGYGIEAVDLDYNDFIKKNKDLTGKAALIDLSNPDSSNPHSEYAPYNGINYRIEKAIEKGASAIVLFNTNQFQKNPDEKYKIKANRFNIPIVFVSNMSIVESFKKRKNTIEMQVALEPIIGTGNNIVAQIDNKANYTVVIGAHYDHIGYGSFGSRYTGPPAIHNGADDNASGTAMLIELAKWLKQSYLTNNNYTFVAFSGEEMGLYGSKALVKSDNFNSENVNYMLNYDMVGRLNEDSVLSINGVGTSNYWSILDDVKIAGIATINKTESGLGPSDHASFYLENIPAIHFFSGAHNDYHKPSDDEEFINYNGIEAIFNLSTALIDSLDNDGKLDFKKTVDTNTDNVPKFTVTLGVMPDYVFAGKGMRIDGVTEGKTAFKADIKAGDIVTKMGDYNVTDMMSYMEALSKFKKGDKTTVEIIRNDETKSFEIEFQ